MWHSRLPLALCTRPRLWTACRLHHLLYLSACRLQVVGGCPCCWHRPAGKTSRFPPAGLGGSYKSNLRVLPHSISLFFCIVEQ